MNPPSDKGGVYPTLSNETENKQNPECPPNSSIGYDPLLEVCSTGVIDLATRKDSATEGNGTEEQNCTFTLK